MTDAISVLVTSLGDFPLDPDAGRAWLWSGGGDRLLWLSEAAAAERPARGAEAADPALVRSFAPLLALPEPEREPIRVHQLGADWSKAGEIHTCLCRHVPLTDGGFGLLAVAIGAPARSMAQVRGEPAAAGSEPEAEETISVEAEAPAATVDPSPEPAPEPEPLSDPAPAWIAAEAGERSPLRFVWQTDADGRFVHISRELAEAVGPAQALVLGLTWDEAAAALGLAEGEGIAAGFRSRDTWTAPPAFWPVAGGALGVPVEMAGLKVVEAGRFEGFRGYGIARIERAAERPASAVEALAADAPREPDPIETRFGPDLLPPAEEPPTQPPPAAEEPFAFVEELSPDKLETVPDGARDLRRGADALDAREEPTAQPETAEPEIVAAEAPLPPASPAAPPEPILLQAPATALDPASPLSTAEREAFREIARALSAMTETLGRPAARRDLRPLELLPRDPAATSPQAPEAKPASVVPHEALQARRNRAKPAAATALLDALPLGLLVTQDGAAVFANRALLEITGDADFAAFAAEGGAAGLFDAHAGAGRFGLTTRKGDAIVVEAAVQAADWEGKPAALTTVRRVPDDAAGARQKALEMELNAARDELRELRSVLDTATDGVILLDGEGRILSLNRSAEALFGFDQNEIAGESLTALLDPDSHAAALDYLEGLRSNGVHSLLNDGRDVRGRERNGGAIPLSMTIGRVSERQGATKFCAVLRDITHWKKVESDLIEAKRAAEDSNEHKSDFLAKVSHEIRTPLNAIIGFSQVMMSESFGPIGSERYKQYVRDIHASGEHVVSLVNDLLDLSKIAAGKLELAFGSVEVNGLVAESVAMIQPQANAGRVIVRSQLAADLPAVVADERSVRQIMLNLLSNAAKFTEAGGQVVASTSLTEGGEVVIRVSDTGIGMAEEDVKKALEPFRQIPGPRASGGTGLGLPLTKALVEANRASFAIRSEPRKGTLVEVVFPSTRVLAE